MSRAMALAAERCDGRGAASRARAERRSCGDELETIRRDRMPEESASGPARRDATRTGFNGQNAAARGVGGAVVRGTSRPASGDG